MGHQPAPSQRFMVNCNRKVKHMETMVKVKTKRCPHCLNSGEVEVPIDGYNAWVAGEYIQAALPTTAADIREQLISGFHPDCWKKVFGEPDNNPTALTGPFFVAEQKHDYMDDCVKSRLYGPFTTHVQANGYMQTVYDAKKEALLGSLISSDDSDCSNFFVDAEQVGYFWSIVSPEAPE